MHVNVMIGTAKILNKFLPLVHLINKIDILILLLTTTKIESTNLFFFLPSGCVTSIINKLVPFTVRLSFIF